MWMVNNLTPFATERTWVRDKNGAEVWLVAIKGTFDIQPNGLLAVAEEQEDVNIAPKLREDSDTPSLLYDTDLPHKKSRTDVLVEGHAYAPNGKATSRVIVELKVSTIQKRLAVIGDRTWEKSIRGLAMSRPKRFVKMPLVYERAFGGTDTTSSNPKNHEGESRNPAGCGFATKAEHLVGKPIPNIEEPDSLISHWKDRPAPAGFAPIAGHWAPRVTLAGTYDQSWLDNKQPLLPNDFDEAYYQCAPQDQQTAKFLRGGEFVEILNLTPSGYLKFHLPRLSFGLTTNFDDGTSVSHRAVLHTVTIKPDSHKVILVWHMHHECHHKVLKLTSTTIRIKERIMLSERNRAKAVVI